MPFVRRFRRVYYDCFSIVYDRFVALHSSDRAGTLRKWLIKKAGIKPGIRVLDLCTGTGSVAIEAVRAIKNDGIVVGLDFSFGMLKKAKEKSKNLPMPIWIEANAIYLPFKDASFDVVLCSHAFYELTDPEKAKALGEIKRVLAPDGRFYLMEHEQPENALLRFLYRVRLASMGSWSSYEFITKEMNILSHFFSQVIKEKSPTGNSKIIICHK